MNSSYIKVFVIAIDGIPRNERLLKQLDSVFESGKVEVVEAITPDQINQSDLSRYTEFGSQILGRHISAGEIAVALSHRKCYQIAASRRALVALIFEDDVDISDTVKLQKTLSQYESPDLPTISTLYSPMWGIWKLLLGKHYAVIPPAYACSYLINSRAMQIALANESIGLADWPIWSEQVYFHLIKSDAINQSNAESTIEKFRQISLNQKKKYKFTFSFKVLLKLGAKTYFLHRVYYPYLWKRYLAKEVRAGNRKKGENHSIFLS